MLCGEVGEGFTSLQVTDHCSVWQQLHLMSSEVCKASIGVKAKFCCFYSSMFVFHLIREEMKVKPFVALLHVHQDLEVP